MTLSDWDSELDSRLRFDETVECSVCRLVSSIERLCSVLCKAAFWEESAGRAEVDWVICWCSDWVTWCERWESRASFSGFTGIGGTGMLGFLDIVVEVLGVGRGMSNGESSRLGGGAGFAG